MSKVTESPPAGPGRPAAQYLSAEHVVAEMADHGTRRLQRLSVLQILVLAMLGGGFVTVGALFSVLLATGVGSPGAQRLVEGLGFSAGFFFVILSDAVLFTEANVVLPDGWEAALPAFPPDEKGIASRDSSGQVLNQLAQAIPWLLGGSADLSPSTKTSLVFDGAGDFQVGERSGRNVHLGVREHAAAAIANGLALAKLRPFWSGFLIFSDYARGAIRLSALMEIPVLHIFTHDSIGVGEDGPTHQPVEQLASLRAMPGLLVFRPCDAGEVTQTWRIVAALRHEPTALILSRQRTAAWAPAAAVSHHHGGL